MNPRRVVLGDYYTVEVAKLATKTIFKDWLDVSIKRIQRQDDGDLFVDGWAA